VDIGPNPKIFLLAEPQADWDETKFDGFYVHSAYEDSLVTLGDPLTGVPPSIIYERNDYPTPSDPLSFTGQYLVASLETKRDSLIKLLKWLRASFKSVAEKTQLAEFELFTAIGTPSFEGLLSRIRELRRRIAALFNAFLDTVLALRRVTQSLRRFRKIFFVEFRPYRGFSWSKRSWSLLHGSHPPKTSAQMAVLGCA
jgi:hypothetical protein